MRTKNTNLFIDAAVKVINESARRSSGDVVYTGYVIANGDEFIKFGPQPAGPKQTYTFSKDFRLATPFRDFGGAKAAIRAFTERLGLDIDDHTKSIQASQKQPSATHWGRDQDGVYRATEPNAILKKEIDSKRSLKASNLQVLKVTVEEAE